MSERPRFYPNVADLPIRAQKLEHAKSVLETLSQNMGGELGPDRLNIFNPQLLPDDPIERLGEVIRRGIKIGRGRQHITDEKLPGIVSQLDETKAEIKMESKRIEIQQGISRLTELRSYLKPEEIAALEIQIRQSIPDASLDRQPEQTATAPAEPKEKGEEIILNGEPIRGARGRIALTILRELITTLNFGADRIKDIDLTEKLYGEVTAETLRKTRVQVNHVASRYLTVRGYRISSVGRMSPLRRVGYLGNNYFLEKIPAQLPKLVIDLNTNKATIGDTGTRLRKEGVRKAVLMHFAKNPGVNIPKEDLTKVANQQAKSKDPKAAVKTVHDLRGLFEVDPKNPIIFVSTENGYQLNADVEIIEKKAEKRKRVKRGKKTKRTLSITLPDGEKVESSSKAAQLLRLLIAGSKTAEQLTIALWGEDSKETRNRLYTLMPFVKRAIEPKKWKIDQPVTAGRRKKGEIVIYSLKKIEEEKPAKPAAKKEIQPIKESHLAALQAIVDDSATVEKVIELLGVHERGKFAGKPLTWPQASWGLIGAVNSLVVRVATNKATDAEKSLFNDIRVFSKTEYLDGLSKAFQEHLKNWGASKKLEAEIAELNILRTDLEKLVEEGIEGYSRETLEQFDLGFSSKKAELARLKGQVFIEDKALQYPNLAKYDPYFEKKLTAITDDLLAKGYPNKTWNYQDILVELHIGSEHIKRLIRNGLLPGRLEENNDIIFSNAEVAQIIYLAQTRWGNVNPQCTMEIQKFLKDLLEIRGNGKEIKLI